MQGEQDFGAVFRSYESRVAGTLPQRSLRSEDLKGINKGTRMQRRQKGVCTWKLGNSDIC